MAVTVIPSDFGNAFSQTFATGYRSALAAAEAEKERKRQEEINRSIFEAYRSDADKNIAPAQIAADKTEQNLANARSTVAGLSAPIVAGTSPQEGTGTLADTRSIRGLMQDPAALAKLGANTEAPIDPAQLQAYNAPAIQQGNTAVAQAQTQNVDAQQMLAQARERYGTAMFDRLSKYADKIPPQVLIGIVEKGIQNAEAQANKTALSNAMKVFGDKTATPEKLREAAITVASLNPTLGKMFQNYFAPKDGGGFTLGQGQTRYDAQGRPIVSVAPKPDRPERPVVPPQRNINGVPQEWINGQWVNVDVPDPSGLTKDELNLIAKRKDQAKAIKDQWWVKETDPITKEVSVGWAKNAPPEAISEYDKHQKDIESITSGAGTRMVFNDSVKEFKMAKAQNIPYEQVLKTILAGEGKLRQKHPNLDVNRLISELAKVYGIKDNGDF